MVAVLFCLGCQGAQQTDSDEEPIVLEYGSTEPGSDYIVTDTGDVIYTDSRSTLVEGESGSSHNPDFPPIFPESQRVYPADENPSQRESYITRAPFDVVEEFYGNFFKFGNPEGVETEESLVNPYVQNLSMRDESGKRSTALYINEGGGPRGGMKVLLKDFPSQHAVQIVLTTLDATPPGLNPYGNFLTPEELEVMFAEVEARLAEQERIRAEIEAQAIDPARAGEDEDDSDTDSEDEAESQDESAEDESEEAD